VENFVITEKSVIIIMSIEKKIIYKMTLFQLPTEVSKTNVIVFFTEAYG